MKHLKTFEYYNPQDPMGMPSSPVPMRRGRFEEEEETSMPSYFGGGYGEEEGRYGEEEGGYGDTCPSCNCTSCECGGEEIGGYEEEHFMHDAWDEMDDYEMGENEISVGRIKKFEAKKLDKVGEEDDDINNDGKKNKTDDYLANRRKKIGQAISGKKTNSEPKKPSAQAKKGAQSKTPSKAQAQKSTKDEKKNPKR